MKNTKVQTLTTIAGIVRKYKKKYCKASQRKILQLLYDFYGTDIKRRQLNYHLADLRRLGLIKTIKRTHRNKNGTLCLETSATCITPKGYYELWKLGSEWARKMYERLIKKYIPRLVKAVNKKQKPDHEELTKRRELGRAMFKTQDYKEAFGLE